MSWDCPCARGKLPNPTSRVGQQAGRTPLSRPPTLGTAAAGPVTPAGRVGGGATDASRDCSLCAEYNLNLQMSELNFPYKL